jgi:hypothetical protein
LLRSRLQKPGKISYSLIKLILPLLLPHLDAVVILVTSFLIRINATLLNITNTLMYATCQ